MMSPQVAPIHLEASPSRPILYPLHDPVGPLQAAVEKLGLEVPEFIVPDFSAHVRDGCRGG